MRRGLLKDLANTPTQIACGWRLYADLARMRELAGSAFTVNLLDGTTTVGGIELSPSLYIAGEASAWLMDRLQRDGVPPGTVRHARLTLTPHQDGRGLTVECGTVLETELRTYHSTDVTHWQPGD